MNHGRWARRSRIRRFRASSKTAAPRLLAPGATGTQMQTGSINNALINNVDNIQSRASASYVTGSHNVKLGYQGIYSSRSERRAWNDLRLRYTYDTPTIPTLCTTAACSTYANAPSELARRARHQSRPVDSQSRTGAISMPCR